MTKEEAIQYIIDHEDDDELDEDEIVECYRALYGEPDDQDYEEGLWSHCCVWLLAEEEDCDDLRLSH